ncbi:MAG: sterol desaturase family protein [Betaproteobacteria bacterium]|nr:sterol desaturase family protein [Betaproteobacteria bacterium]
MPVYAYVALAIAAFAILMAAEFAYGAWRGRNTYGLADTLSNLGQGLISQWVSVCTLLFQTGLYALVYGKIALFGASGWDTWYGWVAAVVLFDFCDYWLHRVGHESALFWAAHAVHHQSRRFNLSTALRQESFTEVLGWPFYLPMAVLGVPPEMFAAAGLIVNVYQFWVHTEHVGKLGWFDRVFSSPSNHRVHHAINAPYLDKNYGGLLVLWDRLFGTFAEEREPCRYGTLTPPASARPLDGLLSVYAALWKGFVSTQGWRAKARILLGPPSGLPSPDPRASAPPGRNAVAACVLFLLVTLATVILLWNSDAIPWLLAAGGTAATVAALDLAQRLAPKEVEAA